MFKKILVANRGVHAIGMAQQIARARVARGAISRGGSHV